MARQKTDFSEHEVCVIIVWRIKQFFHSDSPNSRRRRVSSGRPGRRPQKARRTMGMLERWRRMTTTWSSAGCVKTEESCSAATRAHRPTTSTASTRRSQRSPTESGSALAARWAANSDWHVWLVRVVTAHLQDLAKFIYGSSGYF